MPQWFLNDLESRGELFIKHFEYIPAYPQPLDIKLHYKQSSFSKQKIGPHSALEIAAVLADKLHSEQEWYLFAINLAQEFALELNRQKLLEQDRWYLYPRPKGKSNAPYSKLQMDQRFVLQEINPLFKKFLIKILKPYGFTRVVKTDKILDDFNFRKHIQQGHLILDTVFKDAEHGEDIHLIHALFIAYQVEKIFSREYVLPFYKALAQDSRVFRIWELYLDNETKSRHSPESLTEVLGILLPNR